MESDRRRPRNSNHKSTSAEAFLHRAVNATTEQHFQELLKNLVSALSKDSSNNVAIVAMVAMFFAFAVMALKPATPAANPPAINVQVSSPNYHGDNSSRANSANRSSIRARVLVKVRSPQE